MVLYSSAGLPARSSCMHRAYCSCAHAHCSRAGSQVQLQQKGAQRVSRSSCGVPACSSCKRLAYCSCAAAAPCQSALASQKAARTCAQAVALVINKAPLQLSCERRMQRCSLSSSAELPACSCCMRLAYCSCAAAAPCQSALASQKAASTCAHMQVDSKKARADSGQGRSCAALHP